MHVPDDNEHELLQIDRNILIILTYIIKVYKFHILSNNSHSSFANVSILCNFCRVGAIINSYYIIYEILYLNSYSKMSSL